MGLNTSTEFASSVRSRFPGVYDSWGDDDLTIATAAKFPQYRSAVDWSSLAHENKDKAVRNLGGDADAMALVGHFPIGSTQVQDPTPSPMQNIQTADAGDISALNTSIASFKKDAPLAAQGYYPQVARPQQIIAEGDRARQDAATREFNNQLAVAQSDYDQRLKAGKIPMVTGKATRPVGLLGEVEVVDSPVPAEERPNRDNFGAKLAGATQTPFQNTMGQISGLARDVVAPVTNLITGRDESTRSGRIMQVQEQNFIAQKETRDLKAKQAKGIPLTEDEKSFLADADQGIVGSTVQFFQTMANDPEARKDMIEIMGSELPMSIATAPVAEAGFARVYGAMKGMKNAYLAARVGSRLARAESMGALGGRTAAQVGERFASSQASSAARQGIADAVAEGDSRLLMDLGKKVGVNIPAGARRVIAGIAKEAPAEAVGEGITGTATGYGRGENELDAQSLLTNMGQEGLFGLGSGVLVGAGKGIAGHHGSMSLENADAAAAKVDLRPWVQANNAPEGVTRPAGVSERAGVSSVPAAASMQAHPEFQTLMQRIAEAAKNPEMLGQRFRVQANNVLAAMTPDQMASAGYSPDIASEGMRVNGYSVRGDNGSSTAVVNGTGNSSTLAHEVIHGVEHQAASDPELAGFNGQIESWKSAATEWARNNGWDVPADPRALRNFQSELFTQTMNTRLGGDEHAQFSQVPMPDDLVQTFAAHAGDVVRNGNLDLRGDKMPGAQEGVHQGVGDSGDIPFSLQNDMFGGQEDLFSGQKNDNTQDQKPRPIVPSASAIESSIPEIPASDPVLPTQLDDFGEKIGGAKKDLWKDRSMVRSDLESMNEREAQKLVTRKAVWPEPDWAEVVSQLEGEGLARNDALRSAMMRKNLRESISNPDPSLNKEQLANYVQAVEQIRNYAETVRGYDEMRDLIPKIFGKEISNGFFINRLAPVYKLVQALGPDFVKKAAGALRVNEKLNKAISKGWPGEGEPWQKKFRVIRATDRRTGVTSFYANAHNSGNAPKWSSPFETREDAIAWAKNWVEQNDANKKSTKEPAKPKGGDGSAGTVQAQRVGGKDWRQGRNVTGEDLLNEFGFRGGEFGLWANPAERQASVNFAYDSLHDLAEVMGVPPKALSLNGQLALAFGARGSGGASAHYEPGRIVINLTKTSGAGALAHEWAHAVDDYYSRVAGLRSIGGESYVSHGMPDKHEMRSEMADAWKKVTNAMLFDENFTKSAFHKTSEETGKYWGRKHEMFARAFESWVSGELDRMGVENTYLTNGRSYSGSDVYPQGADRERIFKALTDWKNTIKTKTGENGNEIMYSLDDVRINDDVSQVKKFLPKDPELPKLMDTGKPREQLIDDVIALLTQNPVIQAVDGIRILLANPDGKKDVDLRRRAWHLCASHERGLGAINLDRKVQEKKAKVVSWIPTTLQTAAIVAKQGSSRLYFKRYKNGSLHVVITDQFGMPTEHGVIDGALITQRAPEPKEAFKGAKISFIRNERNVAATRESFGGSATERRNSKDETTPFSLGIKDNISNLPSDVNTPESSKSDVMLYSLKPQNEQQEAQLHIIKHLREALRKNGIFIPVEDASSQWGSMPKKAKSSQEAYDRWARKWNKAKESLNTMIQEDPVNARMAGIKVGDDAIDASAHDVNDVIWQISDWVNKIKKSSGQNFENGIELAGMRNPDNFPFEWPESERKQTTLGEVMDGRTNGYISVLSNQKMYVRWDPKGKEWVVRDPSGNENRINGYDKVWVDASMKSAHSEAVPAEPKGNYREMGSKKREPVIDYPKPASKDIRDIQPSAVRTKVSKEIIESIPADLQTVFTEYAQARDAVAMRDFAMDAADLEKLSPDDKSKREERDLGKLTRAQALGIIPRIEKNPRFHLEIQPKYQKLLGLRRADLGNPESNAVATEPKPQGRQLKNEKTGQPLSDETFFTQKLTRNGEGQFLNKKERLYTLMVDEAYPIEKVQKLYDQAHGVTKFEESLGAKVDQVRGAAGVAKAHAESRLDPIWAGGRFVVNEGGKEKPIKLSRLDNSQMNWLDRYLVAKTALWRYQNNGFADSDPKEGRFRFNDPFLTESKAKEWIAAAEKRKDFTELEKRAKMVWEFHRNMSLMKLESGHWDPEMYAQVTQDPFYIPLIRDVKSAYGTKGAQASGGSGKFTSTDNLVRGTYVLDRQVPYARPYVASRIDEEVAFGEMAKAEVMRGIVDLGKKDPAGIGELISKLEQGEDVGAGTRIVSVVEGGKIERYKVDEELAGFIDSMGPHVPPNALLRTISAVNQVWKGMTTSWNPDFSVANFSRDVQESAFNTQLGGIRGFGQYLGNLKNGFWEAISKGGLYQDYRLSGGMMDSFDVRQGHGSSVDEVMYGGLWSKTKDPANYVAEQNPKLARMFDRMKAVGGKAADVASALGEVSEMTTRLAMYKRSLDQGMSKAEAIRMARQGTLDFQRHGTIGKSLNAYIPFFNAAIQGTDKTIRTLTASDLAGAGKDRSKAVAIRMAKAAAFGAAPTIGLVMWNSRNENYKNIPIPEREGNWILMLSGNNYLKVPKAAWQKFLMNGIQVEAEQLMGVASPVSASVAATTARGLANAMPIGEASGALPPLAKLLIEESINKDFYFRSPIWNENVDPRMQVSPWTSETMKKVGFALGLSPVRMEHVMRNVLGGNTTNFLWMTDIILSTRDDVAFPKSKRSPFLKRFYGQSQEWGGDLEKSERETTKALRSAMTDGKKELKKQVMVENKRANEMETAGDIDGAAAVRAHARELIRVHIAYIKGLKEARSGIIDGKKALDSLQSRIEGVQ